MSGPYGGGQPDRPFEDRPDDGRGWHEPEHLGGWSTQPSDHRSGEQDAAARPAESVPEEPVRPTAGAPWRAGPRGDLGQVFRYQGDEVGAQGWALQHGWTLSDGTEPGDAVLAELIASAPVAKLTRDHRPATVLRGRFGTLELVACDVVYPTGRFLVPQYAITAAPLLAPVPYFRLSPTRFWKHRTGRLMVQPSGDQEFDARWALLTAEDSPAVRALAGDATVRDLLLATDDGDEFWSAAVRGAGGAGDFIAAIRPDGHRPELLEHHGRLLTAIVAAVMSAM